MLNRSRGSAVWVGYNDRLRLHSIDNYVKGPRAQVDRKLYKMHMQDTIFNYPNLDVRAASVSNLVFGHHSVSSGCGRMPVWGVVEGVRLGWVCVHAFLDAALFKSWTDSGDVIPCSQVVICTGTFLSGEIHIGRSRRYPGAHSIIPGIGMKRFPAGRMNEAPATGLSHSLRVAGFQLGRLQTGTPARLDKSSITFDKLERQDGDQLPHPFSYLHRKVDHAVTSTPCLILTCGLTNIQEQSSLLLQNAYHPCYPCVD